MLSSSEAIAKNREISNNDNHRSSNTRRKIEIKRVVESSKPHVTISKRKQGLFNKVTELSILCQAETALIIKFQNGKFYSCGYPTPEVVIYRFLNKGNLSKNSCIEKNKQKECVETLRKQYETTQEALKEEKMRLDEVKANNALMGFTYWWDYNIDEMGLEELEQFKASLEQLKINLMATMEAKRVNSIQLQPMMMPSMLPMQNKYSNFLPILNNSGGLGFKQEQQPWSVMNNNVVANCNPSYLHPNNADFSHYYHR